MLIIRFSSTVMLGKRMLYKCHTRFFTDALWCSLRINNLFKREKVFFSCDIFLAFSFVCNLQFASLLFLNRNYFSIRWYPFLYIFIGKRILATEQGNALLRYPLEVNRRCIYISYAFTGWYIAFISVWKYKSVRQLIVAWVRT